MAVMSGKVLKVNGVPFAVNRVIQNISEYTPEFIKSVLENSNSEFRVEDGNGTAFFCSKVESFEFQAERNKWVSEKPRSEQNNFPDAPFVSPRKHNPRTKRRKKCKRCY
jgi:YHS domain-containing protein